MSKLIGKKIKTKKLGKVKVLGKVKNSRVLFEVECLDRGVGWNEKLQRYTGKRISTGWYRGENREFGSIDSLHKKDLS